jgi:molybdate transport system substrate-binding protein
MTMRKALALAGVMMFAASGVIAAEINVFSAGAVQEVEKEIAAEFAKQTGHKVTFTIGTVGQIQEKLKAGAPVDVIVVSAPALEDMAKTGVVRPDSRVAVGRIGIGVGYKAGAPKPDISSPDAFRETLLKAKAITYMDPAVGASSGIAFARILSDLGIADQMKPKTKLTLAGYSADKVASGEVELAIQNQSEIMPVKGVTLAGPLPGPLQVYTPYAAGVATKSGNVNEAQAFIRAITDAKAAEHWRHAGIEPAAR